MYQQWNISWQKQMIHWTHFVVPLNLFVYWLYLLNSLRITNGHWISTLYAFDTYCVICMSYFLISTLFFCNVFHQPLFLWAEIFVEFYEDIPPLFILQKAIGVFGLEANKLCITIYQTGIFSHIFNNDWDNIIKLLHLSKIDECSGWFSSVWEIK